MSLEQNQIENQSPQALKNIQDFNQDVEQHNTELELKKQRLVKLKDKEKIVLHLDMDKSYKVFRYFDKDNNNRPVETDDPVIAQEDTRYRKYYCFVAFDPNMNIEREFQTASLRVVNDIMELVKNGEFMVKIKRIGSDKDTRYDVEAA